MRHPFRTAMIALLALGPALAQSEVPYFKLSEPVPILQQAQAWEGDQQPHTLSVLELNRGGHRYWGWYGLNEGRGTGLAFSEDLRHWTKYEHNPLWRNARWTSALAQAEPGHPDRLYFAVTRDYDTPRSRIVLACSDDGIQLRQVSVLVPKGRAPRPRNQNPNLFRDPRSGRLVLTYYAGNDNTWFDIVARSARTVRGLATAPERVLLHDTRILAAPTMLYAGGTYYLATEVCPQVGPAAGDVSWQVKVFQSERLDGPYRPAAGNPVQVGDRACLFQHVFNGRFYGFQSHRLQLQPLDRWEMEVIEAPLP